MKRLFPRALAALSVLAGLNVQASHLIGGNLGYTYVGETAPGSGLYRYNVYMQFFMNCGPDSNWETLFELLGQNYNTPLEVGAYIQDINNPNADKALYQVVNLTSRTACRSFPICRTVAQSGRGSARFKATSWVPWTCP